MFEYVCNSKLNRLLIIYTPVLNTGSEMTNIVTDIGLKTWAGLRQCSVCLSQANHGE